jgi:signal transduction histidine kinase
MVSMELLNDSIGADPSTLEGKLMHNAMNGVNTLNNRLNELLDLAKMNNGTFQFDRQPIEAGDFLESIARRFSPEFKNKNQVLVADVEKSLPVVKMDARRIEIALAYLLNNASTSSQKGDPIVLRARVDNRHLVIDIEDRGKSISPEERERLFEPYHRVEQDRQRFSGLGLGLALTKQIVDAHGGWINLDSTREEGNKFQIGIPIEKVENPVS